MPRRKKEPDMPQQVMVLKDNLDAMADNVSKLSEVGQVLKSSRLKERAVLLLLKDVTGMSLADIKRVLDGLPKLEQAFLK